MNLTEQLTLEHVDVKNMLAIISRIAMNIDEKKEFNTEHFASILNFLKVFVDQCHHGKEEQCLFPALEKTDISKSEGVFKFMIPEHNQGRAYVLGLREAFGNFQNGDNAALNTLAENSHSYVRLLFHHIDQEDSILFPMAEEELSEDIKIKLMKDFEAIEEKVVGPGVHEKFEKLINDLSGIYIVDEK